MNQTKQQIIALGGGGFSMEPDNLALDRYILDQSNTARPAICFLATASGDASQYIVNFYTAYSRFDCRPSHVTLFGRTPDLREVLLNQDIIFVGGGNTKSMLAVWQAWDLPAILRDAWQAGVVLSGISAGAICWFEQGITDSAGYGMSVLECMGFLGESCCPHFDGEPERQPAFRRFLQEGQIQPGYALDDGAAAHFVGSSAHQFVASRPDAGVYRMDMTDNGVDQTSLSVHYLE